MQLDNDVVKALLEEGIPAGSRVGAVRDEDAEKGITYLYGWGTYDGMQPTPGHVRPGPDSSEWGIARDVLLRADVKNIRVELANDLIDRLHASGVMTEERMAEVKAHVLVREEKELAKSMQQRIEELLDRTIAKPRITLDDGRILYGHQCHWATEEVVREHSEKRGFKFVLVDDAPNPFEPDLLVAFEELAEATAAQDIQRMQVAQHECERLRKLDRDRQWAEFLKIHQAN